MVVDTSKMRVSAIRKKIKETEPDIIICFTQEDTQICFPLPYIMKNTDFYYYNLEIYVQSIKKKETNIYNKYINKIDYLLNKLKEIFYVKGCQSIVIQDKLRKEILKKYWISHSKIWLIPNSYYSDNNKYNVPRKTGLIYSGSVGSDVLGTFIKNINDIRDVEITISGWYRASIISKKNHNIKVIKQNLSQDKYTEFISAYAIALIWYSESTDENVYNIGLASGKYFKHLSLGQPVIVNRVPGLAEEIEKYRVGVVINNLSELYDAVQEIESNYDAYVQRIKRVYDKRYDYGKVSHQFFDCIICDAKEKRERK